MQMCVLNMDVLEIVFYWLVWFLLLMIFIWVFISILVVLLFVDYIIKVIIINMRFLIGFKECILLMGEI